MARRRSMTNRSSRKVFKRGTRVHKKNGLRNAPMRGGIRL